MPKLAPDARQKILASARQLMVSGGYHGTGTEAIIRQAGVSKGSFFYHFADKTQLAEAMLEVYFEQELEAPFLAALARHAHPRAGLIQFIDDVAGWYKESGWKGGCLLGNLSLELADAEPRLRALMARMFVIWEKQILNAIKGHRLTLPPDSFATLYIAALEGVSMTIKTHKNSRKAACEFEACRALVRMAFVDI